MSLSGYVTQLKRELVSWKINRSEEKTEAESKNNEKYRQKEKIYMIRYRHMDNNLTSMQLNFRRRIKRGQGKFKEIGSD